MDNRYFDEGLLPRRFSIHDADVQAPTGEKNLDLTTHISDATGKLFYILLTHSFTRKTLFTPESDRKGKRKAREPVNQNGPSPPVEPESPPKQPISSTSDVPATMSSTVVTTKPTKAPTDPLSDYTCPICFSPSAIATITPCGHICCGSCSCTAVKAGIQRSLVEHHLGGNRGWRAPQPRYVRFLLCSFLLWIVILNFLLCRCPVCRSIIPVWRVIALKTRSWTHYSLRSISLGFCHFRRYRSLPIFLPTFFFNSSGNEWNELWLVAHIYCVSSIWDLKRCKSRTIEFLFM